MTCSHCEYAAKFHSYQQRRVLTVHGGIKVQRAYYYCGRCKQSFIPYDDALGLVDEISPGLMPLVCLAGTLLPFADAARWPPENSKEPAFHSQNEGCQEPALRSGREAPASSGQDDAPKTAGCPPRPACVGTTKIAVTRVSQRYLARDMAFFP